MKIVKRDGRTVEYNPDKIRIAINKANNEVMDHDKISEDEIETIIDYIESLGKKRMLVEDIQDIIEEKLMEKKKFTLAKTYIIYRYKRSIIRKSNTTDASIMSLLKNGSYNEGNYLVANRQRDVMAGEASKDLAYRLLLPNNVVAAEKQNRIKFCNVEYFTEPIIESSKIDLENMLENGTVINGIKIDRPKSFQSAANVLVEIIASVASCQTGNIYIELKDLFKYYYFTYEKKYAMYKALMKQVLTNEQISALARTQSFIEVKSGIQTIFYQINTITLGSGLVPRVHFLINVNEISSEAEETIVHEFIRQKTLGIADENGDLFVTQYPKIIYALGAGDKPFKSYEYITKELLNSQAEFLAMNAFEYSKFNKQISRFNQGSIILNLARLALDCKNSLDNDFFELLEENLGYCYEGFLCRNHNLQGIYSDKSPIHWKYGAIARLQNMEKIDIYLKKEFSFMTLVVVGFEAALKVMDGDGITKKIIKDKISDTIKKWNNESTFEVVYSNYYDERIINEMIEKDQSELKKYEINSYFDSLGFLKNDYFRDGFIYYRTDNAIDLVDVETISKDIIIKKSTD